MARINPALKKGEWLAKVARSARKRHFRPCKRGICWEVTEMGWDKKLYYTRSRKVNGRVIREYVGAGQIGFLAAQLDEINRDKRETQRVERKAQRDMIEADDGPFDEMNDLAELVARAALVAAGFRQHKRGEWRKQRVRKDDRSY